MVLQRRAEMTLKLRPYQEECLETIKTKFSQGVGRQLVHLPTAAGKTVIFSNLIQQLNRKTLVLAHTYELLDQAKDKIEMITPGIDVGIVNADSKEFDSHVVVSSIQSARQPETLAELQRQGFSLCIYDEAHRAAALSPRHILSSLGFFGSTENLLVGFSATPFRTDNKGLGEVFDEVVYKKTIKDLINLGFLCNPVGVKITTDLDLSTVKTEDGDFVTASLASVMNTTQMNELVVNAYIERAVERKTVCFAVNVSHAKSLAEAFKNRGISSEAIYGELPSHEREDLLNRFQNGSISVLTNCQILTEGWDCPQVDCVLVAKPTQSKGLYQQMCGRGLRLWPNKKDCLILDFGSKSHSLCSTNVLIQDSEEFEQKRKSEGKMVEFAKSLPPSINKKLRASIIEFDLLGDSFTWLKDGSSYYLKATGGKILKIFPTSENRFSVIFFNEKSSETVCKGMSFEYAFSSAEEFAKNNRGLFVVNDLEAPWRRLPISNKQKELLRSFGYRAGIDELSRGQASLIISSGALNRKAARR
jgi:ATP-dependent helicase IRC3